jgi:hypothetical protein
MPHQIYLVFSESNKSKVLQNIKLIDKNFDYIERIAIDYDFLIDFKDEFESEMDSETIHAFVQTMNIFNVFFQSIYGEYTNRIYKGRKIDMLMLRKIYYAKYKKYFEYFQGLKDEFENGQFF